MTGAADSLGAGAFAASAWLRALEFPRPNGSAALDSATVLLQSSLAATGLEPRALLFDCTPHRNLAAAAVLCLSALLLHLAARRRRRALAGLTLGLWLVAAAFAAGPFDALLPGTTQTCLLHTQESLEPPRDELLLVAHVDSKSEPLDHAGRALLLGVTGICALSVCGIVLRRRRAPQWLTACAVGALVGTAVQLSWGVLLPERSFGIVDDAGACVLLADLASELRRNPPPRTRVHFLWTSGEEVGAQGAAAVVRHASFPSVDRFINLEGIGAGSELSYATYELGAWRAWPAHGGTEKLLRRCHRGTLRPLPFPLWSDAGALCAAGLEGVTLLNLEPGAVTIRGLHGSGDRIERFDWEGYERTRALLLCRLTSGEAGP